MRVFKVILGILSVALSMFCLGAPFLTEYICTYIAAIYALVIGIIACAEYAKHKGEKGSGISLAGGIIAILFMIFAIFAPGFLLNWMFILAIVLLIAIIVEGITTVVGAFTFRGLTGGMKAVYAILGILMIIAGTTFLSWGIFGAFEIIEFFGIITSIGICITGVRLIISAFAD